MIKMDIARWCRICSNEVKCGVFLFGEDALLHAKIRKYLYISISLYDQLPKMICEQCIFKIDEFHAFATRALENQEKMAKCMSTPINSESSKTNVSLLQTDCTNSSDDNAEAEILELDPMSVLQCCLEESDSEMEPDAPPIEYQLSIEPEEATQEGHQQKEAQESISSEWETAENTRIIYLCSICKKNFNTNCDLQEHMLVHTDLYSKQLLNLNLNQLQGNVATVLASDDKVEEYEILLQIPEEESGEMSEEVSVQMEGPCRCPICVKDFPSKVALQVHLESHRPKGQFGCDSCGRVFKTECNLFRHKEYHEGVRFSCEVCGRVYPTNSTLKAHSITHSDLRPHKCPTCEKTFKRNQDLKFHINQHTGARPYQCPYCPKAFASSGNCFSHRKRMHLVEVEQDRERAAKIMR